MLATVEATCQGCGKNISFISSEDGLVYNIEEGSAIPSVILASLLGATVCCSVCQTSTTFKTGGTSWSSDLLN